MRGKKGERMKKGMGRKSKISDVRNMVGEGKRREEIILKPLISRGQKASLCQGETQSEGQGLPAPSLSLRSSYH